MTQPCPFELCDGDGLRYDSETNTAYPCRCRQQIIARRRASSLSAVIPRRYRDEYYEADFERPGEADLIIAKHRNGAVGEVTLTFQKEYPKFMNYAGDRYAG